MVLKENLFSSLLSFSEKFELQDFLLILWVQKQAEENAESWSGGIFLGSLLFRELKETNAIHHLSYHPSL